MSRAIRFEVWRDDQLVDATTLTQDVIKIGRLPSSHLRIDDESVARMHAVLEVQGDRLRLVDLGSSTGTMVNGARVEKTAAVKLGDALAFGPYQVRLAAPPRAVVRPAAVPLAEAFEKVDDPEIAEVMAVYGNTVLDVQHVGKRLDRRMAYGWMALGGALLLGGASYVASQTVLRGEAWEAYHAEAADAAAAGRPAPTAPGSALSGLGVALGLLGLVPLGIGAVRLRDRDPSRYTIGEGDAVSFATTTTALPDPSGFPLVASNDAGDTRVCFTPQMQGLVVVGGQQYTLEQLVASGQAIQQGAAFSFPLPKAARCRIQHGDITFHVNAVKPGKVVAGRGDADKSFWLYNAASLVGLGTLLGLAQLAMPPEGDYAIDDAQAYNRFVGYIQQPDIEDETSDEPDEEELVDGKAKSDPGTPGKRAPGSEGKMGKPDSKVSANRRFAMKGPADAQPMMARNHSADVEARQAGILGMIQQDSGHFLANPNGAFAIGNDDEDVWGNLTGTEVGESVGAAGLGLAGSGRGGGGQADGLIGLSNVGLIGGKGSCSDGADCKGLGYSRGKGAGFKERKRGKPVPRIGKATVRGALDKDIIRRVVRAHINQVSHCYNQGLVRDPTLQGRVAIQFTIGGTGKVPVSVVSSSTLKDKSVGNCIASAVKRWKFPKPQGGATVMVTYPFVLNPS